MLRKLKNLFINTSENTSDSVKTIQTLDLCDDVWIEQNGEIQKGWVWGITRNNILILKTNKEIICVHYNRPLTQTVIENSNLKLYLNEKQI